MRLLPSGCQQVEKKKSTALPNHKSNLPELPQYKNSLHQQLQNKAFRILIIVSGIIEHPLSTVNLPY